MEKRELKTAKSKRNPAKNRVYTRRMATFPFDHPPDARLGWRTRLYIMFGSFRKHQKWIWIAGVIVIIPSFVVFFSPDARLKGSGGGNQATGNHGTINGKPISFGDFNRAYR